jgi:hypothetical protein
VRLKIERPSGTRARLSLAGAAVAALLNGPASAGQIDVGNPEAELRFDNTIRYNAGWRMEKRDQVLADTWGLQGGEYKFDKGDLVTNRIDLLTELDFVYKKSYGFRVSGASWYDAAYDNKVNGNPAYQAAGLGTAYPGNVYTHAVSRYYLHSAEVLDAFAFGRVNLATRCFTARRCSRPSTARPIRKDRWISARRWPRRVSKRRSSSCRSTSCRATCRSTRTCP